MEQPGSMMKINSKFSKEPAPFPFATTFSFDLVNIDELMMVVFWFLDQNMKRARFPVEFWHKVIYSGEKNIFQQQRLFWQFRQEFR